MDLSIITTEALETELKRRRVAENKKLEKRDFLQLAKERNLTDSDIVLIAETFRDGPILWDIKTATEKLGIGERNVRAMAKKRGCPVVRKGTSLMFIAGRLEEWLVQHIGEDITG